MDMEELLCPQISMDVDETPLELGNRGDDKDETGSTTSEEMPLDVKIKILLEVEEFDAAQIPEPLTEEEEALKLSVFNLGPAVQFMRLHCTSCNVHLGSAPTNQFNRFIHPLLHVLLCKSCYDFYSSGDFEKDEDGSELYCRWCGQGGKVMCCSDCCFVFCQKCVRANLGKKILDAIKSSEEWKCFVCNPQQLINLKLICHSLYQYILSEIKIAKESGLESALTIDHSMCCKPSNRPVKRKRSASMEDVNYCPNADVFSVKKMKNVLKTAMTSFGTSVSTNGQMAVNPSFKPAAAGPVVRAPGMPILNKYLKVRPMARQQIGGRPRFAPPMPRHQPVVGTSGIRNPVMANQLARPVVSGSQNYIPLNTPPIRIVPSKPGPHVTPVVNCVPANLAPGTKHNWFEQAATITSNITNQLSRKLATFSMEQKNATTIEQLASIHNKLQELLSSSVNSLIHVRKNLRNEFLNDLNKMKFAKHPPPLAPINVQAKAMPRAVMPAPEDDDDDDVIIVNNEEDPLALDTTSELPTVPEELPPLPPPPQIEHDPNKPRIFLKLKPVSSLMEASRLPPPPPEKAPDEHIDLCDEDEEEISECKEPVESPAPKQPPEVDFETSRQIKRALSESKYEAVVEDNLKVKVIPGVLSENEIKRMVKVRVIVNPKWIPKVSDNVNKSAVCDNQEIRSDGGNEASEISCDDDEVVEGTGKDDSKSEGVCEITDESVCLEKPDAMAVEDVVNGATDRNLSKSDDLEETTTLPEATTSSVDESEETTVLAEATTAIDESEKTTSSVEELEKTSTSIEELEKTSTSIEELEESTPSAAEAPICNENEELDKTDDFNKTASPTRESENKDLENDSSDTAITPEEKTNSPEDAATPEEVRKADEPSTTELNSGPVNGDDSGEKVNSFSDSFNPFRNVENGDDIYDRRKEPSGAVANDKVTEFDVSTDPVTTTDSGIEVDAK